MPSPSAIANNAQPSANGIPADYRGVNQFLPVQAVLTFSERVGSALENDKRA